MVSAVPEKQRKHTVLVAGLGNIGSNLIPNLARLPDLVHVILIDKDIYELKNIQSQDICPGDVGKPKSVVQAQRLNRINPSLKIEAIVDNVDHVPLGRFRSDVILTCLDTKEARRIVHQSAYRLGITCIDTGVNAQEGSIARMSVYVPGPENPCLECGWSQRDYDQLEQAYPCMDGLDNSEPTNAPSMLGSLAASLQLLECQKILTGDLSHLAEGRELLIDAQNHTQFMTSLKMNSNCRFDHEIWSIYKDRIIFSKSTLVHAIDMCHRSHLPEKAMWLGIENRPFVKTLQCQKCSHLQEVFELRGHERGRRCTHCDSKLAEVGFEMIEKLNLKTVEKRHFNRSLESLGFRVGDIISVGGQAGKPIQHIEISYD